MPGKTAADNSPNWEEIQPFTQPIDMVEGSEFAAYYRGANELSVPDPNAETPDGKRVSLLHEFSETPDGEPFGLWGSGGLDKRLAEVPNGSFVRVLYEGKTDLDGGRTARQYRVWVDRNQPF